MKPAFQSLWQGPTIDDGVEWEPAPGATLFYRWRSTGLYALDSSGQPWTLAIEDDECGNKRWQWLSVDELTGGVAR